MGTYLVHTFPMAEWFHLSANLDMNWLEIVFFVVFMEDGIPLFHNVKVTKRILNFNTNCIKLY